MDLLVFRAHQWADVVRRHTREHARPNSSSRRRLVTHPACPLPRRMATEATGTARIRFVLDLVMSAKVLVRHDQLLLVCPDEAPLFTPAPTTSSSFGESAQRLSDSPLVEPRGHRLGVGLSAIPHPYPVPDDDTSAYPGCETVDGKCPVPGCDWAETENVQEHIQKCWTRYLRAEVVTVFGHTHELPNGACPWNLCGEEFPDPADLAQHLMSHSWSFESRCLMVREDGDICCLKFRDYSRHLEVFHGLIAADQDSTSSVTYCPVCYKFFQGQAKAERHLQSHLHALEQAFQRDPLCFADSRELGKTRVCVFHFADRSAPATERLKFFDEGAAHVVTHLLEMDGRYEHACIFELCDVQLKPIDMIDHLIEGHALTLTPFDRRPIEGDLSLLDMTEDTANKLKAGEFPITKT